MAGPAGLPGLVVFDNCVCHYARCILNVNEHAILSGGIGEGGSEGGSGAWPKAKVFPLDNTQCYRHTPLKPLKTMKTNLGRCALCPNSPVKAANMLNYSINIPGSCATSAFISIFLNLLPSLAPFSFSSS